MFYEYHLLNDERQMLELVTTKHYNVSEILLQNCLTILTLTGVRGQTKPLSGKLYNENIIFVSKIVIVFGATVAEW